MLNIYSLMTPSDNVLALGQVVKCCLVNEPRHKYYVYLPTTFNDKTHLLVAVHGISRRARAQARLFAAYAERNNVAIVAPYFDHELYPDYQRLGRSNRGLRADRHLEAILCDFTRTTGLASYHFSLFGYSGGAQFSHRYAMAYPERVNAMVLGAAGWYTLPDELAKFPYGIQPSRHLPGIHFEPKQFLRIPACVCVGEMDNLPQESLRNSSLLNYSQGVCRISRGQHWVQEMAKAAQTRHYDTDYRFELLPNVGHSFSRAIRLGGLGEQVFNFIFPKTTAPQNRLGRNNSIAITHSS